MKTISIPRPYRKVSEAAVLVIVRIISIDLMAEDKKRVNEVKEKLGIVETRTVATEHSIR